MLHNTLTGLIFASQEDKTDRNFLAFLLATIRAYIPLISREETNLMWPFLFAQLRCVLFGGQLQACMFFLGSWKNQGRSFLSEFRGGYIYVCCSTEWWQWLWFCCIGEVFVGNEEMHVNSIQCGICDVEILIQKFACFLRLSEFLPWGTKRISCLKCVSVSSNTL